MRFFYHIWLNIHIYWRALVHCELGHGEATNADGFDIRVFRSYLFIPTKYRYMGCTCGKTFWQHKSFKEEK